MVQTPINLLTKPQISIQAEYEILEIVPDEAISTLKRFIESVVNAIHLYNLDERAALIHLEKKLNETAKQWLLSELPIHS